MKYFLFAAMVAMLATGCATDENGKKLGAWQTLKKWDESMSTTEARLQNKNYQN